MSAGPQVLHAGCVAIAGRGLLILGPSGSGKSALALQLLALGAGLVSDDRTELDLRDGRLFARAPAALSGLIEARGLGILRAPAVAEVELVLAVDLGLHEDERLPPRRTITLAGATCELVHGSQSSHFPAALMCYLRYGRLA